MEDGDVTTVRCGSMATIARYALGFLLVAHGYVHFVYVASSRGWFADESEWSWNGRSWLLSGAFEEGPILDLASVGFLLVAVGFAAGGVGYVLGTGWWTPVLAGSAVLSTILYVVMWDGVPAGLLAKGALGVLVDLGVLAWLSVLG